VSKLQYFYFPSVHPETFASDLSLSQCHQRLRCELNKRINANLRLFNLVVGVSSDKFLLNDNSDEHNICDDHNVSASSDLGFVF